MMASDSPRTAAPRSAWITTVAWAGIVAGGLGTCAAAAQVMMIALAPAEELDAAIHQMTAAPIPELLRWGLNHARELALAHFAFCLATLISAAGLLRRLAWARVAFVGVLGVGVAYAVAAMSWQASMMDFLDTALREASGERPELGNLYRWLTRARPVMMGLGVLAVLVQGWIAIKLSSPSLGAEFSSAERAAI